MLTYLKRILTDESIGERIFRGLIMGATSYLTLTGKIPAEVGSMIMGGAIVVPGGKKRGKNGEP